MTTPPNFSHALFTTPFDHTTDFTELADNCERFVDVLVECDDPAQKMAICGRHIQGCSRFKRQRAERVPESMYLNTA